jgi:hypothetical protein
MADLHPTKDDRSLLVNAELVDNFTRKRYQWEFEVSVYRNEFGDYSIYISVSDCNRQLYEYYCESNIVAKVHLLSEQKKNQILSKLDKFIDNYIKSKKLPANGLLREIDESQAMADGLARKSHGYHCDCCSGGKSISFYQTNT